MDSLDYAAYEEECYEMRANGLTPPTYAAWKSYRELIAKFIKEKE